MISKAKAANLVCVINPEPREHRIRFWKPLTSITLVRQRHRLPNNSRCKSQGSVPKPETVAGFYLENYLIKSEQGNPNDVVIQITCVYYGAPVLVNDITVVNPTTNQPLTLDGILGTNMLAGNALIDVNSQLTRS